MPVDAGPVGRLALALMEQVEADYEGKRVELRAAMVIVDVGVEDVAGESWTHVRWHFGSAPDFNRKRASSAYGAGVCLEALAGLTAGGDFEELEDSEP